MVPKQYESDVRAILAKRRQHGADHWATPVKRLDKAVRSLLQNLGG